MYKCDRIKVFDSKTSKLSVFALVILFILLTGVLNFYLLNFKWTFFVSRVIALGSFLVELLVPFRFRNLNHFRTYIYFFAFIPFFSSINILLFYDDSIINVFSTLTIHLLWFLYFVFHRMKISEKSIFWALGIIALLIFFIQLFQQFSYPTCFFGIRSEELLKSNGLLAEERNGLHRYLVHFNGFFTMPVLLLCFFKIYNAKMMSLKFVIPFVFFAISIYLSLTRQVMIACIVSMMMMVLFRKESVLSIKRFVFMLLLIVSAYVVYDLYFSSLLNSVNDDAGVRFRTLHYAFNKVMDNPLIFFFGSGSVVGQGTFSSETMRLQSEGIFMSDIGFVGTLYKYGIFYDLCFFCVLIKLLFKLKSKIPIYIWSFFIFMFFMSPMIFPFSDSVPSQIVVGAIFFYICDLRLNRAKKTNICLKKEGL